MIRLVLTTWAAAAVYGFALGAAHSDLYALRNVAKMPLLLLVTAPMLVSSIGGQLQDGIAQMFRLIIGGPA